MKDATYCNSTLKSLEMLLMNSIACVLVKGLPTFTAALSDLFCFGRPR